MTQFCPLKFNQNPTANWDCEELDCAWWDGVAELCGILSMASALVSMARAYTRSEQPQEDALQKEVKQ